jgi:predicted AAA+ superfamily ATPase
MLTRHFETRLRALLRAFSVVCVLGPRQCGKTTFIRSALPRWRYLDLEKSSDAARLAEDPEDALRGLGREFILDEAQRLPAIFPLLRSFVDGNRARKGQLVMLGSASLSLITQISESLAGRVGFLDMTPFRWDEVRGRRKDLSLGALWFRGGFPGALLARSDAIRHDWFDGYTRTFIEHDLTALGVEVSGPRMRRLWTMLAHANGGLWNASQLAASLGVSYHTVNRYVDILEQTFLIRKLQPYFANLGKRLTKNPKVYFRDTGLLHYFLGISSPAILDGHQARGASWEAFVLDHAVSAFALVAPDARLYFWRTVTGSEVDILVEREGRLIPMEIKLHSAPRKADVPGLVTCMADLGLTTGYVLYPGSSDYSLGGGIRVLATPMLLADPKRFARL